MLARLSAVGSDPPGTGVLHVDNERGSRGGYSLFVPETCEPTDPPPLIVALHGGRGHARFFLWSWLSAARAAGAMLIPPTATGATWALRREGAAKPNLIRTMAEARARRPNGHENTRNPI